MRDTKSTERGFTQSLKFALGGPHRMYVATRNLFAHFYDGFLISPRRALDSGAKANSSAGFTLLEVILYLSLAAIVLYAVSLLYAAIALNGARNNSRVVVEESAAHLLRLATDAIRRAEEVVEPTPLTTSDSLILEMADDDNPTVITISGGLVELEEEGGAPVQISSSDVYIDSLEFTNRSNTDTSHTVHIEFTAQYLNDSNRPELDYSATFYGSATTK